MKYILSILFLFSISLKAQITPPGLGDTNAASWYAMGLRQKLNDDANFESMTYIGVGLKSGEDNYDINSKLAIVVINQEFYHHIKNNWKVSYAVSYRNQKDYFKDENTNVNQTKVQQELRLYSRLSYSTSIGKVKLTQTARQELRKFVDNNWKNIDKSIQLRSRLKTQVALTVDRSKQHTLTAGAESLFSMSRTDETKKWDKLKYKEARFTLFYTYRPKDTPVAISVGYMNNLIKNKSTHSVHYASFDLVWEDPFHVFI